MSVYNLPDYNARFFDYKQLDRILGQPDIETIVKLFWQVKRNAQRVPTTLGGGQLGYLALVIDTPSYNAIPGSAPFIRPTNPGVFIPVPTAGVATRGGAGAVALTPGEIATQRIAHDERQRLYNKVQAVERALRNQIIDAIEAEYLQPLRNVTTDMINDTIPDILLSYVTLMAS